jgi:hypothetical protein
MATPFADPINAGESERRHRDNIGHSAGSWGAFGSRFLEFGVRVVSAKCRARHSEAKSDALATVALYLSTRACDSAIAITVRSDRSSGAALLVVVLSSLMPSFYCRSVGRFDREDRAAILNLQRHLPNRNVRVFVCLENLSVLADNKRAKTIEVRRA